MREYYVTVKLSDGGFGSLVLKLEDWENADYDTFKLKIDDYDYNNMDFDRLGLYSSGHIIAWSRIEYGINENN